MDLFEQYNDDELLLMNIQFLGFDQHPWDFIRGGRTERIYTDSVPQTRIKDFYTYIYSDGDRVATPDTRTIEWLKDDGSVGLTKNIQLNYSAKALKNVHRSIRQGRLDYLETAAENLRTVADGMPVNPNQATIDAMSSVLPVWVTDLTTYNLFVQGMYDVANNINAMFLHYEVEVNNYIQRGTMEFEDAVNNETDPDISTILAIEARTPDAEFPNGLTVKQSIMYQLTGVKP